MKGPRFRIIRSGGPFDARCVTGGEHLECMRLVHDVYAASGYILPNAAGVRGTQWDSVGVTFGVYSGDELAGCLAIVEDGSLGLPSDKLYPEICKLREPGGLLVEVTNLAVKPEY